jgi:hypothetical protein
MTVYGLPIELYQFTDVHFQDNLFATYLDQFDQITRGLILAQSAEWINELYVVAKHFWGGSLSGLVPKAANHQDTDILDILNNTTIEKKDAPPFVKTNIGNIIAKELRRSK